MTKETSQPCVAVLLFFFLIFPQGRMLLRYRNLLVPLNRRYSYLEGWNTDLKNVPSNSVVEKIETGDETYKFAFLHQGKQEKSRGIQTARYTLGISLALTVFAAHLGQTNQVSRHYKVPI